MSDLSPRRIGKATASQMSAITAKGKGGAPSATRANYAALLICERLTGQQAESYTSKEMQWGKDFEAQASAAYTLETGLVAQDADFVDHPTIPMSGCSPDGTVGDDGLIERKCPNTATHLDTILMVEPIEGKYIKQMQWQMACTGRSYCDFVSFDPRLPVGLQLYIERVNRDDRMIAELEDEVRKFLAEVDAKVSKLKAMMGAA